MAPQGSAQLTQALAEIVYMRKAGGTFVPEDLTERAEFGIRSVWLPVWGHTQYLPREVHVGMSYAPQSFRQVSERMVAVMLFETARRAAQLCGCKLLGIGGKAYNLFSDSPAVLRIGMLDIPQQDPARSAALERLVDADALIVRSLKNLDEVRL